MVITRGPPITKHPANATRNARHVPSSASGFSCADQACSGTLHIPQRCLPSLAASIRVAPAPYNHLEEQVMISLDAFTGEAHDMIDEQHTGTIPDEPLTHTKRRANRRSARGRRSHRRSDSDASGAATPKSAAAPNNNTDDEQNGFSEDDASAGTTSTNATDSGDSRVYQLFQLLSLKNHTGDAKRALVQRLLGVNNVNALVLSKATEEQIASAANDAITDEILATVDMEDKRRQSESEPTSSSSLPISSTELVVATHDVGPYRVLELVDVLDSTTGGLVKRILTNVRRRQRGNGTGTGTPSSGHKTEFFCGFCVDYRTHNTAQHKCRRCGACGVHRSQYCTKSKATTPSSRPPTPRSRKRSGNGTQTPTSKPTAVSSDEDSVATRTLTPDAGDKSFCSFCSTWGFHGTENHRCRLCGVQGTHRSRHCSTKSSSEGYRWRGSPAEPSSSTATTKASATGDHKKKFCDLCNALRTHTTQEHRCRICLKRGEHRSKACPLHTPTPSPPGVASASASSSPLLPARPPSRGRAVTPRPFCSFCGKDAAHKSEEHICRICRATGLHRSGDCPARGANKPPSSSQSVLSYSVETASKVRARVLESIPLVLPASATTLVMDSIDKVGDVDTILRRTLQRLGVWGGGSQTPITTPYAAPLAPSSCAATPRTRQSSVSEIVPTLPQPVDGHGVYVVSYAEGRSVVPERILKYMRLLMHHEISTNAFSVVVVFDPRPSTWELAKPGMVTPRSLPSSPTMSEQLKKRMAKYTLQTLLGAREKLVTLVVAQKRFQQQQNDRRE